MMFPTNIWIKSSCAVFSHTRTIQDLERGQGLDLSHGCGESWFLERAHRFCTDRLLADGLRFYRRLAMSCLLLRQLLLGIPSSQPASS